MLKERAIEVMEACKASANCGPWSDQLGKHLTHEEKRYVFALWETMPGESAFIDAFLKIVNDSESLPDWLPRLVKLCGEYADKLVRNQIELNKSQNREAETPIVEQTRQRLFREALKLCEDIHQRNNDFVAHCYNGRFHPCNKASRELFQAITGRKLPTSVGDTRKALVNYAPEAFAAYAAEQKRIADLIAAEDMKAESIRMTELMIKLQNNQRVTGEQLLDLLKYHQITIHPRTAGMIRKRITEIGFKNAEVRAKTVRDSMPLDLVWEAVRKLQVTLNVKESNNV